MKKSKFSEEQIVYAIKQVEAGVPIPELCRKYGISQQTFYRWRNKYGGLAPSELKRLKDLERENGQLKKLVADLRVILLWARCVGRVRKFVHAMQASTPTRPLPSPSRAGRLRYLGAAVLATACTAAPQPDDYERAFTGLPVPQGAHDTRGTDVVDLVGQVGVPANGVPLLLGQQFRAALSADGQRLAVLDSDCSVTFVDLAQFEVSEVREGPCGEGPDEVRSAAGQVAFVGDEFWIADGPRSRYAIASPDRESLRWVETDDTSIGPVNFTQLSESAFLAARIMRPPLFGEDPPRLLAIIDIDGRVVRELLLDAPIANRSGEPHHARACVVRAGDPGRVAVANLWMGQILILELTDPHRVVRNVDVTPEWYVPREQPTRYPHPSARIACGSGFAVVSYQEFETERNPLIPGRAEINGIARSRVVVIDESGEILSLRDYVKPAWPAVGAALVVAGGGGERFVGYSWDHELVSAVAVYEVRLESQPGRDRRSK